MDEVLVLRKDFDKTDKLEKEQIRIMICDAHKGGTRAHREVGSYSFDLTDVYVVLVFECGVRDVTSFSCFQLPHSN